MELIDKIFCRWEEIRTLTAMCFLEETEMQWSISAAFEKACRMRTCKDAIRSD